MKTDAVTNHADIDILRQLNADYIRSVQMSDGRRFDELLADDFLNSNPDGSLVDRAQFLAQIAAGDDLKSRSERRAREGHGRLRHHPCAHDVYA